jgi:hypothetical protein
MEMCCLSLGERKFRAFRGIDVFVYDDIRNNVQ